MSSGCVSKCCDDEYEASLARLDEEIARTRRYLDEDTEESSVDVVVQAGGGCHHYPKSTSERDTDYLADDNSGEEEEAGIPDGYCHHHDRVHASSPCKHRGPIAAHCHVGCPVAYCLHDKLKKNTEARLRDRERYDDNMTLKKKQLTKLRNQVVDAQALVKEYSTLTEKLTAELDAIKSEARHKLQAGGKKYEKASRRCAEMSAKLHDTEISLEASKAREQETKEKLTDELAKATKELCHTRTIALKNKELAALREAELEKEKLQEYALHNKASDLLNNLKQAKSSNREALVQKKMVEDELDELKKEHSKIKFLSEKLQVRVVQLKSELENDRAQRKRERIIAIANDHLRNMKAHMGLVFQTEPWPVSSTHSTGTLLSTVKKGCAGFSSGLRKGDVVTEMNGKQTRSKTEFYAAMFGVKSGDMMHCHIIRPSQGPGIVRAIDVHMGAEGYSLKQVLAIKRLAERKANVYDIEFDVDIKLSGLDGLGCD